MSSHGRRGETHLQRWCQDKPYLIRIVAKIIASCSNDVHWGLKIVRDRDMPPVFRDGVDLEQWHKCYFRTRRIRQSFLEMIFHRDKHLMNKIDTFWTGLRLLKYVPKENWQAHFQQMTRGELSFEWHRGLYFCHSVDRSLDRILAQMDDPNSPPNARTLELIHSPGIRFFFKVLGPCLTVHREHPSQLLAQALAGDNAALEKLLRLDPSLAGMRPFAGRLQCMRDDPAHQRDYDRLMLATHSLPFRLPQVAAIKTFGGALLLYLAKACRRVTYDAVGRWTLHKFRLNSADIRRLFDAISRDRTGYRDYSLPATPWALQQQLKRAQREFLKMLPPGTKESVNMSQ